MYCRRPCDSLTGALVMRVFLNTSTDTYARTEPNEFCTSTINTPDSEYGDVDAIVTFCEKYTSCQLTGAVRANREPVEPTKNKHCTCT